MGAVEIILIILASIVLFLLILLIIPIGAKISYLASTGEIIIRVKIWIFSFRLNLKDKGEEENKKKNKKSKKKSTEKEINNAKNEKNGEEKVEEKPAEKQSKIKTALEMYKKYKELIKLIPSALYRIIERIRIYDIDILWYVHNEDAAKTAISTGQMYAVFYGATAFLSPPFNFEYKRVEFLPDFVGNASSLNRASVSVTTSLIKFAMVAIWFYGQIKSRK